MVNSVKKTTLLLVIIFTFLFSTTSWGEWSYVGDSIKGKYYYDKDRVRKSGTYIYFWELFDLKEQFQNSLSDTSYTQIECSIFQYKTLKVEFYTKQMGEGGILYSYTPKDEWKYPKPNTSKEFMLNKVCEEHR